MQIEVEVNDHDLMSEEARTRRAEEYLHRKEMEKLDREYELTCWEVNAAITMAVAAAIALVAMIIHGAITLA